MAWRGIPFLRSALALPLIDLGAGFDETFHPIARRLVKRCDGVLRIGGASQGADEMVQIARDHGKRVFTALEQLP